MTETLTLKVKTVIGTGDPLDSIMLVPLICDWNIPKNCAYGALTGQECNRTLRHIYVLEEPLQGHKSIGVCEDHHQLLRQASDDRNQLNLAGEDLADRQRCC